MDYLAIRHMHMGFAAISIALFALRGGLALAGADWRAWRPLRWLPHLNDTALLLAAITLAWVSGQYPFQQGWLTAKVLALVVYVVLGRQALRPGLRPARRAAWFMAALGSVFYIVAVAITRSPTLG